MAGAGYRDWVAGNVPTATQFDTYLQEQTVMVFASASARDTALSTAKSEGMVTYQTDTNTLTVYSGAAWSTIGPVHGALLTWTPTVTQSGTVAHTVTVGEYQRVGRRIHATCKLTSTATGTSSNLITVTLPVTAVSAFDGGCIGVAAWSDTSVGMYSGSAIQANTGAVFYIHAQVTPGQAETAGRVGTGVTTAAIASTDVITATISYTAAADA